MERAFKEENLHTNENSDNPATIQINTVLSNAQKNDKQFARPETAHNKIIFNTSGAKFKVVRHVGEKIMNWTHSDDQNDWDIAWIDFLSEPMMLSKIKSFQKLNYFPGIECLARKDFLGMNLRELKKEFPQEYDFFPDTYILPSEYEHFKAHLLKKRQTTFIVKPKASCQGRGIFLTQTVANIDRTKSYIVQKYLNRPYLIEGLKFDLRIYVLITHCDPLKIYLYKDGLARFATEPYQTPNENNLSDMCMHLTNYSVNKHNSNFIFNESANDNNIGHKRSLKALFKVLEEQGHDVEHVWNEIKKIVIKTLCSGQPNLAHNYRTYGNKKSPVSNFFHILGLDIILDQDLKPWLLEVNQSPSWGTDTPLDKTIKEGVIKDAFNVLNVSTKDRIIYKKQVREQARSFKGQAKEQAKAEFEKQKKELDLREERACKGDYEKIFPTKVNSNEENYGAFIEKAHRCWEQKISKKHDFREPKDIPISFEKSDKEHGLREMKDLPPSTKENPIIKQQSEKQVVNTVQYSNKPPPMAFGFSTKPWKKESSLKFVLKGFQGRETPGNKIERETNGTSPKPIVQTPTNGQEFEEYKMSDSLPTNFVPEYFHTGNSMLKEEDIDHLETDGLGPFQKITTFDNFQLEDRKNSEEREGKSIE